MSKNVLNVIEKGPEKKIFFPDQKGEKKKK